MRNIEDPSSPSRTTVSFWPKVRRRAPAASRARSSAERGAKSGLASIAATTARETSGRGSGPAAYWCWRITGYAKPILSRERAYQTRWRTSESISM